MQYKRATLVPLGKGHISKVTGVPKPMGNILEARTMAYGYCVYDEFRFTRMDDNRIAIEREFPLANEETPLELSEIFTNHFEQSEKA